MTRLFIKKSSSYTLEQVTSEEEWNNLMVESIRSSFMQSWDYGEALRLVGWKVKRFVISYQGMPIAFFQTSSRKFIFELTRIQHGPIFLLKNYNLIHVSNVFHIIRKHWRYWKGKTLLMSPFLPFSGHLHSRLLNLGYRLANKMHWESALIDLRLDNEYLLSNMKSNWRNKLKKAQKSSLKIKAVISKSDFYWFLERYELFKKEKNFTGVNKDFLESLYKQMVPKKSMHIFLCEYQQQYIAGIIVVSHGLCCSYMLGWNSDLGRKLSAHNLLLWEAIQKAKSKNKLFFDLGGTLSSPIYKSITEFKQGLNGEQYMLVGEYY